MSPALLPGPWAVAGVRPPPPWSPWIQYEGSCPQGSSSPQMRRAGAEAGCLPTAQERRFFFCAERLRLFTEPSHPSLLSFACQHLQGWPGADRGRSPPHRPRSCTAPWASLPLAARDAAPAVDSLGTTAPLFHTNSQGRPLQPCPSSLRCPGQQHVFNTAFCLQPVCRCFSLCPSQSCSAEQTWQK